VATHSRYRDWPNFGICFSGISRHKGTHVIIRSARVLLSWPRNSDDFNLQDYAAKICEQKGTCNDSLSALMHRSEDIAAGHMDADPSAVVCGSTKERIKGAVSDG
jgi:hypothetical protein